MRRYLFVVEKMKKRLAPVLFELTPRIYNLRDVVFVRWLGYEWVIPKGRNVY